MNTPVFTMRESDDPVEIAKAAVEAAEHKGCNVLIEMCIRDSPIRCGRWKFERSYP